MGRPTLHMTVGGTGPPAVNPHPHPQYLFMQPRVGRHRGPARVRTCSGFRDCAPGGGWAGPLSRPGSNGGRECGTQLRNASLFTGLLLTACYQAFRYWGDCTPHAVSGHSPCGTQSRPLSQGHRVGPPCTPPVSTHPVDHGVPWRLLALTSAHLRANPGLPPTPLSLGFPSCKP